MSGIETPSGGGGGLPTDLTGLATGDGLVYNGTLWVPQSVAALKSSLALTKADVGLGNVDNTSDANKPVSTAVAAALLAINADVLTNMATLAQGATFSASSEYGPEPLTNLFDNNDSTVWNSGATGSHWAKVTYAAPRMFSHYRVLSPGNGYSLQYSLNDSDWTALASVVAGTTAVQVMPAHPAARYWRIIRNDGGGGWHSASDFKLYVADHPYMNKVMQAEGDMVYGGGGGLETRLINPGTGTFTLKSVNGAITWVAD